MLLLVPFLLSLTPLLTFKDPATISENLAKISRLDDVIMGGISSSRVVARKNDDNSTYASFSGTIRTNGGGFAGFRTNKLKESIPIPPSTRGVYLKAKFMSDTEPTRRCWKMSLRDDDSRGELVYQAPLPLATTNTDTYKIPFSDFKLVRGPRLAPEGGQFIGNNNSITQVGLTVSMFEFGRSTMTVMEDFRDGHFALGLDEIGIYSDDVSPPSAAATLVALTKEETDAARPLLVRALLATLGKVFSERGRRRAEAERLLKKRGTVTNRLSLWKFGAAVRGRGCVREIATTASIVTRDAAKLVLGKTVKYALFKPVVMISRTLKFVKKKATGDDKQ